MQPGYENFWERLVAGEVGKEMEKEFYRSRIPNPESFYKTLDRILLSPPVYEVVLPDGMIVGVY